MKQGAAAPLEVLVKIIAAIGAKLVIIPDEAPENAE
jgi:hypothetical protein